MSSRQPPAGATFAYETAISALDEQLRRVDGLDSKAGILLAADGVILGLLLRSDERAAPTWVVLAVGVLILTSLIASILALLNRRYHVAPAADVASHFAAEHDDWIRWHLLGNVLEALRTNRASIQTKARFLTAGQASLLVTLMVAGGYLLWSRFTGGG